MQAAVLLSLLVPVSLAVNCPAGGTFDATFNKCYIYFNQPEIFLAAESTCRSIGGHLAEIRNGFENTFVAGLVSSQTNGTVPVAFWIGANLLMGSRWTWTSNDTVLYSNFAWNEPSDPSSYQCASIEVNSGNLWGKELCSSALPFMCTADPITPPVETPCDPGYTQHGDQCFKIFDDFIDYQTFYDSKQFCRDYENATLPKITSAGVQNFLEGFIFDKQQDIWLGLVCYSEHTSRCWWTDNTSPNYMNFESSSPTGPYPISMSVANGQWRSSLDFGLLSTVVVCQKAARNDA